MTSPGKMLKTVRESHGISLKEVAESTKILERYLEYLEEEKYHELPSELYVRGFVQSYARYLRIDPEEVLLHLPKSSCSTESPLLPPPIAIRQGTRVLKGPRRTALRGIAIGASVTAAGIGLIAWVGLHMGSTRLSALLARGPAPMIQTSPKDVRTPLAPPSAGVQPKTAPDILEKPENQYNKVPRSHDVSSAHPLMQGSASALKPRGDDRREGAAAPVVGQGEMAPEMNTAPPSPQASLRALANDPAVQVSMKNEEGIHAGLSEKPLRAESSESSIVRPAPAVAPEGGIVIERYSVCTGVENRIPQDEKRIFSISDGTVYTWISVRNALPPLVIRHVYYFQGEKKEEVALPIRYSTMRTWSYKAIGNERWVGPWRVDIALDNGKVLESIEFQVIP